MTQRINDANAGNPRLREFTRQERQSGRHPAVRALHSRPQSRSDAPSKLAQFLRIARGRTA